MAGVQSKRLASLKKRYGFENPFLTDPLAKKALRYTGAGRSRRLLDIGCGEGADSVFYARKGFRVTAIDKNIIHLTRFRAYRCDHRLSNVAIFHRDATTYGYTRNTYDVINCLLVLCCMKRSQFERLLKPMKNAVKPGGMIILSSRNYLDPELREYRTTGKQVESNTFHHKEDCCRYMYFIEKGRLLEVFSDFEILYYREGFAPCKYNEHPRHGDTYLICRRPA